MRNKSLITNKINRENTKKYIKNYNNKNYY